MPIIQMHEYEHKVLMTLGDMRERGLVFPCFNTINRELPDLNIARLSDCLEKLRWKGMIGEDDIERKDDTGSALTALYPFSVCRISDLVALQSQTPR